ncbi:MAG TPA: hypothetical protein DCO75_04625 [Fibrobacteres bacterium]|jgi:hypothetical protein|nr:hypothetical protein [Fibrobacterota bacterium]
MNSYNRIIFIASFLVVTAFNIGFAADTTAAIKLLSPKPDAAMENPDTVGNPVMVSWEAADTIKDKYLLLKVYNSPNNKQVYPRRDKRNNKSASGVKISLVPGLYKIDLSSLNSGDNTSTWIYVKDSTK